jgi:Transcription factor WhiB
MDTNIWFSADNPGKDTGIIGEPERISLAKMICSGCPVRNDCLDYSIKTDDRWGIMGGLTPQERRRR